MGRTAALAALAACLVLLVSTLQLAVAQGGIGWQPGSPGGPVLGGSTASGGSGGQVIISEVMTDNKATIKDEDGASPDWVELHNTGSSAVSLAGWKLTDSPDGADTWAFPPGVSLAPGQYAYIFCSGKNRNSPSSPLHTSFKLSSQDGYIGLLKPDGSLAQGLEFPEMPTDVSFGSIGGAGVVLAAEDRSPAQYALLAAPTPGKDNTGPRPGGPLIVGTTRTAAATPGSAISVEAQVTAQQNPLGSVELVYVAGYGAETAVPMTASGPTYSASFPATAVTPGALLRWYVRATDSQGGTSRDPAFVDDKERQYYGVIVPDPSDAASLPVLELYCADEKAPFSKDLVPGCSLQYNGSFYDNLLVGRRGVTSLNWPKPKIKIDSKQGKIFEMEPGLKVGEINLNSEWQEPGENTFMREPLVWEVFKQMGVQSLESFNLHMRLNGKYFGKFAFVEQMDEGSLKRWGYSVEPQAGPLWKSLSGEYSNLRWDIAPEAVQFYWKQYTVKGNNASDAQALVDFSRGLAGGAPGNPRSKYLFDAVNLPQVVNHMAAQTLILNQDRCTKNFYIYRDAPSGQWSMFPYDVESGFSIDRGLGGKPAPDYCILDCEQWNSPLYCDRGHPQDLTVRTPWALISAQYDLYSTGRKLLAGNSGGAARSLLQAANYSGLPADPDLDLTTLGPTPTGAPGTFNYLIDSILAVPRTRDMYFRRLRTLMDAFYPTGRLQSIVSVMHQQIRDEAKRDAAQWSNPGDPDRGFQQLVQEQMPIRRKQLYETYGPGGPNPLIPDAQAGSFQLAFGRLEPGASGFVEIRSPNGFAADISGYRLQGAVKFTFAAGTVIPANDSIFAAVDVGAFLKRTVSPKAGEGAFVVGNLDGRLLGVGASVQLVDGRGTILAST